MHNKPFLDVLSDKHRALAYRYDITNHKESFKHPNNSSGLLHSRSGSNDPVYEHHYPATAPGVGHRTTQLYPCGIPPDLQSFAPVIGSCLRAINYSQPPLVLVWNQASFSSKYNKVCQSAQFFMPRSTCVVYTIHVL